MPADEFTRAHFKAIKACIEVADPGDDTDIADGKSPAGIVATAEEGLQILLQHNPELAHDDPMDQLVEDYDRNLLTNLIEAVKMWGYSDEDELKEKKMLEWRQLMIDRLNR